MREAQHSSRRPAGPGSVFHSHRLRWHAPPLQRQAGTLTNQLTALACILSLPSHFCSTHCATKKTNKPRNPPNSLLHPALATTVPLEVWVEAVAAAQQLEAAPAPHEPHQAAGLAHVLLNLHGEAGGQLRVCVEQRGGEG